jgi:hypothetical protein
MRHEDVSAETSCENLHKALPRKRRVPGGPWPTAHGTSWEDIGAEAARKRAERDGFDQRIFLEYIDQVS